MGEQKGTEVTSETDRSFQVGSFHRTAFNSIGELGSLIRAVAMRARCKPRRRRRTFFCRAKESTKENAAPLKVMARRAWLFVAGSSGATGLLQRTAPRRRGSNPLAQALTVIGAFPAVRRGSGSISASN